MCPNAVATSFVCSGTAKYPLVLSRPEGQLCANEQVVRWLALARERLHSLRHLPAQH